MKRLSSFAMLLAITMAVGCGETPKDVPQVTLHPVSGIVNVNGKPAGGATVALHAAGESSLGVVTPHGVTDEAGKFTLTTYQPSDGAPEGRYLVTVSWSDVISKSSSEPEYGPEKLPARYQNAASSGLELDVRAGSTEAVVMDLKSR